MSDPVQILGELRNATERLDEASKEIYRLQVEFDEVSANYEDAYNDLMTTLIDEYEESGERPLRSCAWGEGADSLRPVSSFEGQMRADGMSYSAISRALGTTLSSVIRWCNPVPPKPQLRGPDHPHWKGDAATRRETGHVRAQKLYKLGPCERCGKQAVERHHVDGNTLNNEPGNVQILCRRCHMLTDGRLEKFVEASRENSRRSVVPPRSCAECGRLWKPTRRGMCPTCYERWLFPNGRVRLDKRKGAG